MPVPDTDLLADLGHRNYLEFSRELTRFTGPGGELAEGGGVLLFAASSSFPVLFNGVWRLDPSLDPQAVIDRADGWFAERQRGWSLTLRDDTPVDADLCAAAEACGLLAILHTPEMVRRTRVDERVPAGTELRWVHDHATLHDFLTVNDGAYATVGMPVGTVAESMVALDAFTAPHVHSVVAYVDGAPAAAAQTILSHGIAGVYWVGTLEAARGRGLGDAVTRAVTNRAFDEGARAVSLQASPMGEPIYRRMGYETLYHYTTYVRFEPPA